MITDHLDFLHSDCKEMVSQEKRTDLNHMYELLKPIPDGLKTLIQAFLDHIKNQGIETISTLKGDTVSIQILIPFRLDFLKKIPFRFIFNSLKICFKCITSSSK